MTKDETPTSKTTTTTSGMPGLDYKAGRAALDDLIDILITGRAGPGQPKRKGPRTKHFTAVALGMWLLTTGLVMAAPVLGYFGIDSSHVQPEHLYSAIFASATHSGITVAHVAKKRSAGIQAATTAAVSRAAGAMGSSGPPPPTAASNLTTTGTTVQWSPAPSAEELAQAADITPTGIHKTPPGPKNLRKSHPKLHDFGFWSSNMKVNSDGTQVEFSYGTKWLHVDVDDVAYYATAEVRAKPGGRIVGIAQAPPDANAQARMAVSMMTPSGPVPRGEYELVVTDDVDSDDDTRRRVRMDFAVS